MGSPGSGQGISPEACGIVGPCRSPLLAPFHSPNCTPSCKLPGSPPHKDFLPSGPHGRLPWACPLPSNTLSVTCFCFTNCATTSWFRATALCLLLTLRSGRQVGLSRESSRALGLPRACWSWDLFTHGLLRGTRVAAASRLRSTLGEEMGWVTSLCSGGQSRSQGPPAQSQGQETETPNSSAEDRQFF